jgi:2-polyprenyl-3-methyl-5-hydroxy-6-metoxy-1,4-benzoquinol methylase
VPSTELRACPECGGAIRRIGAIPPSSRFAGRDLDEPTRADLFACRDCRLKFRAPRPDLDELNRLYAAGAEDNWAAPEAGRPDWELAARWVQELCPTGRVLDVGCFDGGFFDLVGPEVQRFGVEIHDVAAANASVKRGVQIVAASYAELAGLEATFDAVVSFDVIEHVHEPREFLTALAGVVRPGGSVLVGTGNADAPTWRLMGARYWYSWYPEHISFVSPRWFIQAAPALGLRQDRVARFSRYPGGRSFTREAALNVAFRVAPQLSGSLRQRLGRGAAQLPVSKHNVPPMWSSAKDHFLVQLRRLN